VPAKERWCSAAGKVTVGQASHWPCIKDTDTLYLKGKWPKSDEHPACSTGVRHLYRYQYVCLVCCGLNTTIVFTARRLYAWHGILAVLRCLSVRSSVRLSVCHTGVLYRNNRAHHQPISTRDPSLRTPNVQWRSDGGADGAAAPSGTF